METKFIIDIDSVRYLMKKLGIIKNSELTERMIDIDGSTISKILSGNNKGSSLHVICRLSRALNCTVESIVKEEQLNFKK